MYLKVFCKNKRYIHNSLYQLINMEGTQEHSVETEIETKTKTKTKLEEILEHLQKSRKLTLPKGYVRKPKANNDFLEIKDNLTTDSINNKSANTISKIDNVTTNTHSLANEDKVVPTKTQDKADNGKKTRKPTAYNVYVKETVIQLQETHKDLSPKERFKLAIKMWSENKTK